MKQKIDFAVGGQAVIEGVMMRSPNYITIAVRKNSGEIKLKDEPWKSITSKMKLLGKPIIRGVINLFEMMIIGVRMINYSASESLDEPDTESKPETKWSQLLVSMSFVFTIAFSLVFSIFLFKFVPLWITDLMSNYFGFLEQYYIAYNLVDGVIKTSIFVLYIALLTLMPSIRRVFEYHGAEHKSIFAYEKGLDLTVANAKKQSRFHPRCGTSFILIVFLISILIYTFVPKHEDFFMNFGIRVLFLPLIAGISYEFLKWSAKKQNSIFISSLVAPGLLFQKLTTKEPDDKQLEVALEALKSALELEKIAHKKKADSSTVIDVP
jgi:uncharacterized protein YqhQ